MYEAKAQLGAVGMQATGMASQVTVMAAVFSVIGAMASANLAMNTTEMTKIMMDFQRKNEIAAFKEEMMDDTLVDAFDSEEVEEEANQVTSQVLAELGIEIDLQFVGINAPGKRPVQEETITEEEEALNDALPDLRARLDVLSQLSYLSS
eukprot:6195209-Ditylum_brightwellii.AAC.1